MVADKPARTKGPAGVLLCGVRIVYGLVLLVVGGLLAAGGAQLLTLGGSPYYLPAGLAAAVAGLLVIFGRWRSGSLVYLALMAVTVAWAIWEAGLDGWALAPRVISPAVLGLPFLIVALFRGRRERLTGVAVTAAGAALMAAVWSQSGFEPVRERGVKAQAAAASDDWMTFGHDAGGAFHSPLTQINTGNVGKLKVAWSVSIDAPARSPGNRNLAVPLKIGDSLYTCTPFNDVLALDPETGKVRWRFRSKPDPTGIFQAKCRGVAHYVVPAGVGLCAERIYTATADGRLIALDAATGATCPGFGQNGQVSLLRGIKQRSPGYYDPTSAPTVVRGKVVVNASVADGQYAGEPSGVIRAYDAVTGKLAWAWDMDRPGQHGEPPPGQFYSSGTPNSWGPMTADEALGLVYLPTGNSTPDYWGGHRSPASNKYASSVVALDVETGEPRWHFQTTHYDVWDYDVGSRPVLFDLKTAKGVVPALIQPTKRGQLFVLDRRTGAPVFPVEEKPAPQRGAVERLSPTQPWSTAMPDLAGPPLIEKSMWGISALDQLWCRIDFKKARYDGPLTPPGLTPIISYPGYLGGVNWGSASIDAERQMAFLLSNRWATKLQLIPRDHPIARKLKPDPAAFLGGPAPQEGAPYAVLVNFYSSPLQAPCQAPPHGLLNAVDLRTGQLVWSRPVGSARDIGPMRKPSGIPFTIGATNFGGALTTAGRLVFVAGTQDHAIRAFDSETGELLFESDLPASSSTTPMTYRSAKSGRQFVLVSSESPLNAKGATYYGMLTAFALPEK